MEKNNEINKSMVDVKMVVDGKRSRVYTKILNREFIEDLIYNKITVDKIVDIAYNGLLQGYEIGYTMLYLKTGEFNGGTLAGDDEAVFEEPHIKLYVLGANNAFETKDAEVKEVINDVDTLIKEQLSYGSEINQHRIREQLDLWYLTNKEWTQKVTEEMIEYQKQIKKGQLIFKKYEDKLKEQNITLYALTSYGCYTGLGFINNNTTERVEIAIYKELESRSLMVAILDKKNKEFIFFSAEGNIIKISNYDRTKKEKTEDLRQLTTFEKYCSRYLMSNEELCLLPFND